MLICHCAGAQGHQGCDSSIGAKLAATLAAMQAHNPNPKCGAVMKAAHYDHLKEPCGTCAPSVREVLTSIRSDQGEPSCCLEAT